MKILRRFSAASSSKLPQDTVSLDLLKQSKYLNFNLTSDLYRMDYGLLVERTPIFTQIEQVELDKANAIS